MPMFIRGDSIKQMRDLWNSMNRKSKFGYISFLQKGHEWDSAEFHLTGIRFVEQMCRRFQDYGTVKLDRANVLEIGCGVGRFLKPLACRFKQVYGVDISKRMLNSARKYCVGIPNIEYHLNDGRTLKEFQNDSLDYCVSAGVFQHIIEFEVILSYIKEALRILRPGGLFLFQFEGNRSSKNGKGIVGAKITASDLDVGLEGAPFKIREVSKDPRDAVHNVVIMLEKGNSQETSNFGENSFRSYRLMEREWISGVYFDIKTGTEMHERQKRKFEFTFYESY
jgi:SAM-dependent methyltransferase